MDEMKDLFDYILSKTPDYTRIEMERDGLRIAVERAVSAPAPVIAPPAAAAFPPAAPEAPAQGGALVKSPIVGTFYAAPSPDAEPFAAVGQRVERGQVLCIVEAMKMMNEIESEVSGVISRVLASNGELVEYGQPLFEIREGDR